MPFKAERRLGLLERWSWARSILGLYQNLINVSELDIPERYSKARWVRILGKVIQMHPALGVCFLPAETVPEYGRLETIDLARILTIEEADGEDESGKDGSREELVERILEEEHARSFTIEDVSLPLWRCRIVHFKQHMFVFFVFHHAIADGRSGLAFQQSLLEAMAEDGSLAQDENDPTMVVSTANAALLPPLELLADCRPSYALLFRTILAELLLPRWVSEYLGLKRLCFQGERIKGPAMTTAKIVTIDLDTTQRLVATCRQRKTTLTSLIKASMCLALYGVLGDKAATIRINTPMSLRPYMKPRMDDAVMGNFVSSLEEDVVLGPKSSLWPLCQAFAAAMTPDVAPRSMQRVGMLAYIGDKKKGQESDPWQTYLQERVQGPSPRQATLELSNLGLWSPRSTSGSHVQVKGVWMSQHAGILGPVMVCSAATVAGGPLSLVFTWAKGTISQAEGESFVEATAKSLASVV